MNLKDIVATLEGLEETIVFKLIDRAQFAQNLSVYEQGKSGFEGAGQASLLDIRLLRHEEMDAEFGRFRAPEERPFNKSLPNPRRAVSLPKSSLEVDDYDVVNVTGEILGAYASLIPGICLPGDDGQYGSSVEHDVFALQAVARRVHFGALYVAESKYRADPETYRGYIRSKDSKGLERLLTRPQVEEEILRRVEKKVVHVQCNINPAVRRHIRPEVVQELYRGHIIPLTKKGEVSYLLNRRMSCSS